MLVSPIQYSRAFEEGYQGETKRELRARINEHRACISKAFKNKDVHHSIFGHFVTGHGKSPEAYLEVTGNAINHHFRGQNAKILHATLYFLKKHENLHDFLMLPL